MSPGFFRGFLSFSFLFPLWVFSPFFSFSSVSQRTWALSFSTPEPGVGFYSLDPLQKSRSICLISWRSLDSSIACCLCSCINHWALPGNQGQNFCSLNTESHIQLYQQIFIASLVTSTSPKMEELLMTCPLTKILEWNFPSVKTYWPFTRKGQFKDQKKKQQMGGERKGELEEREVYQCTVLQGKQQPLIGGGSWSSSSLALLISLTSCLVQYLNIWKYSFAKIQSVPWPSFLDKNEEQGNGGVEALSF